MIFSFASKRFSSDICFIIEAPASADCRLATNAIPEEPGIPNNGRNKGLNKCSAAFNPSKYSTILMIPSENMTAGTNDKAKRKPSRTPVPSMPLNELARTPSPSPKSPNTPNSPTILLKSNACRGPSLAVKSPEKNRKIRMSAAYPVHRTFVSNLRLQ